MNVNLEKLKPITEMCSIFVNMNEKLDIKKIDASINLYMFVHLSMLIEEEKQPPEKNEYWLIKLALKMEMIYRNIILNDKNTFMLKDHELFGYLMGKAYLLTGYYPCTEFVKSVIKIYRPFLDEKRKMHNCK